MLSSDQFVEVVVGDDLVLNTTFTEFNLPITNVFWTRNGEMVSSATDRITIDITGTIALNETITLTVSPVNTPSDGGTYIVTVTNEAGSDMTVFTVNVTGELMYNRKFSFLTINYYIWPFSQHHNSYHNIRVLHVFCHTVLFSQQPQL